MPPSRRRRSGDQHRRPGGGRAAQSPQRQLAGFIAKFAPENAKLARSTLAAMRKKLPAATMLVYDNYNALAIGFGPNLRATDAVFSIAVTPRSVVLYFIYGVGLPDPAELLQGGGNQGRYIRLKSAEDLDATPIRALMAAALADADPPIPVKGRGSLVIKSISAKQRPRRPATTARPRT